MARSRCLRMMSVPAFTCRIGLQLGLWSQSHLRITMLRGSGEIEPEWKIRRLNGLCFHDFLILFASSLLAALRSFGLRRVMTFVL